MTDQAKIKNIAILGSTGSIGTQALEVIRSYPDIFCVEVLTANSNAELLIKQALEFQPNAVVIADESAYKLVKDALKSMDIKVFAGEQSVSDIVQSSQVDLVLMALVGFSGLKPSFSAVRNGKHIALATKEVLVVAGDIITKEALENKSAILPVDSEHSAIFQCLIGEHKQSLEKIILTASGGPFAGYTQTQLQNVTVSDALKHPNWSMGKKITIDSASMMNKGLEVIEAGHLFKVNAEKIEVLIHPQSIIHSMVQFCDGSIKAQMGLPDMRLPILYALGFPYRFPSVLPRIELSEMCNLTFQEPDNENFPCLNLAYIAMKAGGSMPCILNAANEIAVDAFLKGKIKFIRIPNVIEDCMNNASLFVKQPSFVDFFEVNENTCIFANSIINNKYHI